ncbi:electron transport complex subunit RsxC [Elongatibacter sediminis]|uniref:Ion-translocating oxidoreductase complex subunit C n=1 Tax=Elongatibacter sediminis TaxID=3119006 RepID=A0AAW9REL8_9GAMM
MHTDPMERARNAGNTLHPFYGGLRLRHHKRISCTLPLAHARLPTRLFVPLQQHAGPPAEALVVPGQKVLKGEPIGRHEQPSRGWVHAPTSGTVTALARRPVTNPSGDDGPCVLLRPDRLDTWTDLHPIDDWETATPERLRRAIGEAGIVGLGGATFQTSHKVADARQQTVHTVILNGAECEPYISCDEILMRMQPERVIAGARVLQRATGAERTVIAIEDQMGAVEGALRDALSRSGATEAGEVIDIVKVTTLYPEGGERQLIQVLTGLEVPRGGRPTDIGLLCQNVGTAAAAADAVIEGKPLIERIVTVTGGGVRTPRNLIALLGTPVADLIDQSGGYTAQAARLVIGGPLMGYAVRSDDNPVVKGVNCVLVLTGDDVRPEQPEMPCIRCGECARVCPARLLPQQLHAQVCHDLLDEAADFGLDACIECGCCDYVCPSHIPLSEWFRFGKSEWRLLQKERARADAARQRFEARESRLARIRDERQRRMDEKKQALRDDARRKRRIADAVERVKSRQTAPGGDS